MIQGKANRTSPKTKTRKSDFPTWDEARWSLIFALLGYIFFAQFGFKPLTLLAGVGIVILLFRSDLGRLMNLPSLLLLGFVAFSLLTAFWAMSGKFFLRGYTKIFVAALFFLFVALRGRPERAYVRRAMGTVAEISSIYAILSVEAVSTGAMKKLLLETFRLNSLWIGFNGRLSGIIGNANIESSIYALGVFFSLALLCDARKKNSRVLWAALLSCNIYAFLLVVSRGAMVFFALAAVIYLIFAGADRAGVLFRALEALLPSILCALFAFRFAESHPSAPLILLLLNAAIMVGLELLCAEPLSRLFKKHAKAALGIPLVIAALAVVYIVASLQVSAPYTFGETLYRQKYLEPGEHTLQLDADSEIQFTVSSVTLEQVINYGDVTLFSGTLAPGKTVPLTVPDRSVACRFYFTGEEGSVLRSVTIDGSTTLVLRYKLLPGFIAARMPGTLLGDHSAATRVLLAQTGLRLFRRSPVVGNGIGAFETGITSVIDFPFETNHTHNQYVEILLEEGVIGFALFVGALVAMAIALWKRRRQPEDGELYRLYPALCAEFTMVVLQMFWDVSMSLGVFLCCVYTLFGLIVLTCAEPLGKSAGRDKSAPAKETPIGVRLACIALPSLFMATLCVNMYAQYMIRQPAETLDALMKNFTTAAKLDLYEKNDAMLSYVMLSLNDETGVYREQADAYAQRLSNVQSNQIPINLEEYYLATSQYGLAVDMAKLGAAYSASDPKSWNQLATRLKETLFDTGAASPLLTDDGMLLQKLIEYKDLLEERNEKALTPVALDDEASAFFTIVRELEACAGDYDAIYALLTDAGEPAA